MLEAVQLCYLLWSVTVTHLGTAEKVRIQQFSRPVRKKRSKYSFKFLSVLVIVINCEIEVGLCEIFKAC